MSIVVTFLAVFLLREWILQNAGPGPQQEVNQGRVPRPEEFRAEMRAQWRQRRLLNLDQEDPIGLLMDPLLRRVIPDPNPHRLLPVPPQPIALRDELDTHMEVLQQEPEDNINEDEQWVDEDDWMDEIDHAEASSSMRATAGNATETSVTDTRDLRQSHFDDSTLDSVNHDTVLNHGPAPSLLQQLRRQHREHADPNMSFEEFLIHQRHSMADTAEAFPRQPLFTLADEAAQIPADEPIAEQMQREFDRFFQPAGHEAFRRELLLDPRPVANEDRVRERQLRAEQLRRAARIAEPQPAHGRRGFDPQPERERLMAINRALRQEIEGEEDRRALDAAYLAHQADRSADTAPQEVIPVQDDDDDDEPIAEVDGGEEVEMGPEPGFDEEDEDEEGGLIIDGDVDGILEGMFGDEDKDSD